MILIQLYSHVDYLPKLGGEMNLAMDMEEIATSVQLSLRNDWWLWKRWILRVLTSSLVADSVRSQYPDQKTRG